MNMGLIVGRVFFSNGKPAKGASVRLVKIMGLYLASQSETVCNSKGKFALKFPWSGTEFGNDLSIPVTMEVVSSIEIISKDRFTTTYISDNYTRSHIQGYLQRDWMALLNVIASDPTSSKLDLTEFGLDIAKALENLKFSPPIKGQTLSTESWILVSGGTIFFND